MGDNGRIIMACLVACVCVCVCLEAKIYASCKDKTSQGEEKKSFLVIKRADWDNEFHHLIDPSSLHRLFVIINGMLHHHAKAAFEF